MCKYYITLKEALANSTADSYIAYTSVVGPKFMVFKNYYEFLCKKIKYDSYGSLTTYSYMHELVLEPINPQTERYSNKSFFSRKDGRLCFDFDLEKNPEFDIERWKSDIEYTIKLVCQKLYQDFVNESYDYPVKTDELYFVWSASPSPNKISRHLTVKGLYFEDWTAMSNQFYDKFIEIWDLRYNYIKGETFVDKTLLRKNSMMRFVGSYKSRGNEKLILESPEFTFEDSLIRPYRSWDRLTNAHNEQCIRYENLMPITEVNAKNIASEMSQVD